MYTGVVRRGFQMSSRWLGMLLLVLVSGQAHALVCQQRGDWPAVESAHVYEGELPLHYEGQENERDLIWHIHMDIPFECARSDEQGGEWVAEQQSAQPLYVYFNPAWQEASLNAMGLGISVDHGRSIYPLGKDAYALKSDQHMPLASLIRICDHHDEWGCRHWRNAPCQSYHVPVTLLLPIDLYLKHSPPLHSFNGRLLLQVGSDQIRPIIRTRINVPIHLPENERYPVPPRSFGLITYFVAQSIAPLSFLDDALSRAEVKRAGI